MFKYCIILISVLLPLIVLAADTSPDSTALPDSLTIQFRIYEVFGMD